jgi:hypothetical protein
MPKNIRLSSGETISVPDQFDRLAGEEFKHPREPDPEAAARERRDEVGKLAPAALDVWAFMATLNLRNLHAVELDGLTWCEEPFHDADHAVEHYARYPEHGAGLVTGPQDATWGFIGLLEDRPNVWAQWLIEHGTVIQQKEVSGRETWTSRQIDVRDLRPFGQPASVGWQPVPSTDPYPLPKTSPVVRGPGIDQAHRLELLASLTSGPVSHWLLWPYQGRLRWKGRKLADGLELLPPGRCVPISGVRDQHRLTVQGSLARPDDNGLQRAPSWLLAEWGVRS